MKAAEAGLVAPNGEFLELQRRQIPDDPPGGRVWDIKTGTVISETASEKLERVMTPLKE